MISALLHSRITAIVIIGIVGIVRFAQCVELPVNTGDLIRHLVHGYLVHRIGLESAGNPLITYSPVYQGIAWSQLPYSYPIGTLVFFSLLHSIWPTIFFSKLALTFIEALNALLIFKLSKERWLAILYWALPLSMWWVSREGQFEPLQNFFVLLALVTLTYRPVMAMVFLALGVQIKVSALLLLPFFIWTLYREKQTKVVFALGGFAIGCLPTLIAEQYYPALQQVFRYTAPLSFNPYFWNPFDKAMFAWMPGWLIIWTAVSSYLLLGTLLILAYRHRAWFEYFAPIAFLILVKCHSNAQFWYLLLLPAFLMPIKNTQVRMALFLLLPLVEIRSVAQLIVGPFGWTIIDYYGAFSPFAEVGALVP